MKKIMILFTALLFVGCEQIKEGTWAVKDKVYQYDRNLMVTDYDMLRDFDTRY